jgi:hypothetical protein
VVEPLELARVQQRAVRGLALRALVPEVHQEEPDRRTRMLRARAVVETDRLVGREQVIGPPARQQ